jgi:sarcosine oxidase, subunit alpha
MMGASMPEPRPLRDRVSLWLDGEEIPAERGEPVAVALLAAGYLALARSPKFHRPRGPWCLRGACDGCLARVDEVPNVMTCRIEAADGMRIETQNVAGTRETDLLRVTDWFFPEGMNHHELLAGVPGAGRVMQALARQISGLGKLPAEAAGAVAATRRQLDALVVGCGPSGMAAALALQGHGRAVEVVDDDVAPGGSVGSLAGPARSAWEDLLGRFREAAAQGRVTLRLQTTAAGVYGEDVLVASRTGMEVVSPRCLVLAPGAHDGIVPFEGNDLPGVLSARAAGKLLRHGVRLGKRVVVAVGPGAGPFGEDFAAACPGATLRRGVPRKARGSSRVRAVEVLGDEPCDLLVVDVPRAPAYELCAQAGATLVHEMRGFVVRAGRGGRIGPGAFACGEVVGTPLDPAHIEREARALAHAAFEVSPP